MNIEKTTKKLGRPSIYSEINGVKFKKITYYAAKPKKQVKENFRDYPDHITLDVGQDGTIIYKGRVLPKRIMPKTNYVYAYLGPDMKDFRGMLPIHRLVCTAWHGEPKGKRCFTDHIDGNRQNNNFKNLRWATRKENSQKRKRNSHNGAKADTHANKIVEAMNQDGERFFFMNATDASKFIGCSRVLVYRVLNPEDWPQSAKGFTLSWHEIKSGMMVRFTVPE